MKLAVIGREPLDTLQSWVVPLFSSVRNTHQPTHFMPPVPAFPPKVLGTRLSVVPVKEMRRLTLAFPLPIDWEQQKDMQVRCTPYKHFKSCRGRALHISSLHTPSHSHRESRLEAAEGHAGESRGIAESSPPLSPSKSM